MAHVAINSGELRHRVTIRSRTSQKDATGAPSYSENTPATKFPALVQTVAGREHEYAKALALEATHLVTMRYNTTTAAVGRNDAFIFSTRVLEVEAVENVREENTVLIFACKELR